VVYLKKCRASLRSCRTATEFSYCILCRSWFTSTNVELRYAHVDLQQSLAIVSFVGRGLLRQMLSFATLMSPTTEFSYCILCRSWFTSTNIELRYALKDLQYIKTKKPNVMLGSLKLLMHYLIMACRSSQRSYPLKTKLY
jgi:hypothetical protein